MAAAGNGMNDELKQHNKLMVELAIFPQLLGALAAARRAPACVVPAAYQTLIGLLHRPAMPIPPARDGNINLPLTCLWCGVPGLHL